VANKKATTVINTAQSTQDATSITVNGLLQSATTPTVAAASLYTYDGLGRQVGVTTSLGFKVGTTFSTSTGQIIATTNLTGQITAYEYYPQSHLNAGRLKTQTEPDGKKRYFEYNARGELIHKWGDIPYPEERVYSSYGELTQVKTYRGGTGWSNSTWPTGSTGTADTTTWNFQESTGLLTNQVDALTRTTAYEYYASNLFKKRIWARGSSVTFNISDLGDVTGLDYSDSTPDVTYASFDRTGRPRSLTDATGTHTLTYDYAQRLTKDAVTSGLFNGITVSGVVA
jgi:YD repeat-containing protein